MRQKKISPSVAARGETTEIEATFEQAATSKNHNSTNACTTSTRFDFPMVSLCSRTAEIEATTTAIERAVLPE